MRLSDLLQFEANRPVGGCRCHRVNVATVARRWMSYLTTSIQHVKSRNDHSRSIHALASVATSHHALASVATNRRRVGVTLLELLIVMGLLTLLASISLTAARGLMRGNKVAEAATIVQQYLQNAQVRAITNGRPVAVFLDRVSPAGNESGNPVPANYTVNRLQLGEVFPPYMGDQLGAVGVLGNLDYIDPTLQDGAGRSADTRVVQPTETPDGYADMITFAFSDVAAGLGTGGFVKPGDSIEFVGHEGRFRIEHIRRLPNDINPVQVEVHFFNPPTTYNQLLSLKTVAQRHNIYETHFSSNATLLPVTTPPQQVQFRIYRQPTKSLAGSVTLPRGAAVDLSASGIGVGDSGAGAGKFRWTPPTLALGSPARTLQPSPADFSRLGIVFDSQGKVSYISYEDSNTYRTTSNGALAPVRRWGSFDASSTVYLMVGRSEQVLPSFPEDASSVVALNNSYTNAIKLLGGDGVPPSNLMDSENVWITCNPFTGEVRSAAVGAIGEDELAAMRVAAGGDNPALIERLMRHARRLAAAGMRN